ncbi:FG-GAP repeat domain-containing protein, partial [Streptomyces sp. NPDC059743]|uniref:FG-GAP repeat domain-containing protein n=1 Tax=Streptomyces sp. NPDC059743 TaxID=3346928 RepID=UPI003655576F
MKISTSPPSALRVPGNRRRRRLIGSLTAALLALALPMFGSTAAEASTTAEAATGVFSTFGVADWDSDGHPDIITRHNGTNDLWLYPGDGRRGYSSQTPVKIGNGWGGYTSFGVADWDSDGHPDIVTRNDGTNDLWLYPGDGRRGYSGQAPVKIGNGWGGLSSFGVADWDSDGHPDIVTRNDGTNDLWLYPGDGR